MRRPHELKTLPGFEAMTDDEMYARVLASDASCDGSFFLGVVTTGIYCLPSCHARKPFRHNVRFFRDVDSAREAGFRPCRKCYPDDFATGLDFLQDQLEQLAAEVRAEPGSFPDAAALVRRSGYSASRFYQLFTSRFGTTPAGFLTKAKLAEAERLLQETDAPITDLAFAAGFSSLTAFYRNFRRHTGQTPADLRRSSSLAPG